MRANWFLCIILFGLSVASAGGVDVFGENSCEKIILSNLPTTIELPRSKIHPQFGVYTNTLSRERTRRSRLSEAPKLTLFSNDNAPPKNMSVTNLNSDRVTRQGDQWFRADGQSRTEALVEAAGYLTFKLITAKKWMALSLSDFESGRVEISPVEMRYLERFLLSNSKSTPKRIWLEKIYLVTLLRNNSALSLSYFSQRAEYRAVIDSTFRNISHSYVTRYLDFIHALTLNPAPLLEHLKKEHIQWRRQGYPEGYILEMLDAVKDSMELFHPYDGYEGYRSTVGLLTVLAMKMSFAAERKALAAAGNLDVEVGPLERSEKEYLKAAADSKTGEDRAVLDIILDYLH